MFQCSICKNRHGDRGWVEFVASESYVDLDLRWMTDLDFVIGREGSNEWWPNQGICC